MSTAQLKELKDIAAFVIDQAQSRGADESKVVISESIGKSLQWRQGQLEELTREQDLSVNLVLYKNKQKGNVSISDKTEKGLMEAVKAALTSAAYTESDEIYGLTDPKYYAEISEDDVKSLDLWHQPLPDVETLKSTAAAAEKAAYDYDKRIVNSDGAGAYAVENCFWLKSSNGFSQGIQKTYSGINVSVMAKSNDNQQSNYAYDSNVDFEKLKAADAIGKKAAEKALAALNPKIVKTGTYPVLFSPEMAAGIISHFLSAISGASQYRKLGFLPDSMGKQVFPEWLSLVEQEKLAGGSSSGLFDTDGVAVAQPEIIENGKVARYLLSAYAARRLGLKPTGNASGVHNLKIMTKSHQYEKADLLKKMGTGVLVTRLMGQGVNALTGDYSRGASGFWVENSVIQYPVEGITIAGNLAEMFGNIAGIADDADEHGSIHAPSILIKKMTIAG